jgi:hypothetical protein
MTWWCIRGEGLLETPRAGVTWSCIRGQGEGPSFQLPELDLSGFNSCPRAVVVYERLAHAVVCGVRGAVCQVDRKAGAEGEVSEGRGGPSPFVDSNWMMYDDDKHDTGVFDSILLTW